MSPESNHRKQVEVGRWEFGKFKWPKREGVYELLPPPNDLDKTQAKVWVHRGYGLWPGKILRKKETIYQMSQTENDLFAGKLVLDLIDQDRDNFEKLSDQNHFRVAFFGLAKEKEQGLENREKRLADHLIEVAGYQRAQSLFDSIYDVIQDGSEWFIGGCRRTSTDQITNDTIVRQLEIMLIKLKNINESFVAKRDIIDLESSAASGFRS